MRNFVDENPLGCRRTRAILTRHDEHRHELLVRNLLPSSLLHDALFASSNPSPIHRTGWTGLPESRRLGERTSQSD